MTRQQKLPQALEALLLKAKAAQKGPLLPINRARFYTMPHDPPEYVFLGRAVAEYGSRKFPTGTPNDKGGEWTGQEYALDKPEMLPLIREMAARHQLARAAAILNRQPLVGFGRTPALSSNDFTDAEWAAACERNSVIYRAVRQARLRLDHARAAIVGLCEKGTITSAYREDSTGRMVAIPARWWNIDSCENRFGWGQLHPDRPMATDGIGGPGYCYIFIATASTPSSPPFV